MCRRMIRRMISLSSEPRTWAWPGMTSGALARRPPRPPAPGPVPRAVPPPPALADGPRLAEPVGPLAGAAPPRAGAHQPQAPDAVGLADSVAHQAAEHV